MAQTVIHMRLKREGQGSIPGQSMWDLWRTKCHWERFFYEYYHFPRRYYSMFYTLLPLNNTVTFRAAGENLGTFNNVVSFR